MAPLNDQGRGPRELLSLLEVPLRRPLALAIPWAVIVALAVVASFVLPKRYRSSTLILVEVEKAPDSFVQSARSETAGRRLQTIRQQVLSRTRLERVVEETNPYPGEVGKQPLSEIVEDMRNEITINTKGDDAFTIEYTHGDPAKAQKVTARLATLFIDETLRSREDQVKATHGFIESQLQSAGNELEQKEETLRKFKEKRMGSLPEQTGANLSTLQRLQMEETTLADSLRSARDRLALLESNLSGQAKPGAGGAANPFTELERLKGELASLRVRYTDEHPDVRGMAARIAKLEKEVQSPSASDPTAMTRSQIGQARLEVEAISAKRKELAERIATFQARVEQAPRTEQELATLTRDYQKLKENYQDLLKKKMDAQMAERLEERWKGEHFRILDPAFLPESPVFPKTRFFLLGGLLAGLVAGLGLCLVLDFMDPSVKDERSLSELLAVPVLASFPHVDAADLAPARGRWLDGLPLVSAVLREWRR